MSFLNFGNDRTKALAAWQREQEKFLDRWTNIKTPKGRAVLELAHAGRWAEAIKLANSN